MAAVGTLRSVVLYGALGLTLGATAWVASREGEPEDLAGPPRAAAASPAADASPDTAPAQAVEQPAAEAADLDLARLRRAGKSSGESSVDAFARHSWYVPPPPPRPGPPRKPTAPPLPFKYMGRLVEPGREIVFLTGSQDRNYAVSAGDTITGTYRVESISEKQMTLTYLPLDQQQTLQFGGRE